MAPPTRRRRSRALAALALAGTLVAPTAARATAQEPLYEVAYLGTLGGNTSAAALNERGWVVGTSALPNGLYHAYWTDHAPGSSPDLVDMGAPGWESDALGLNAGRVVGGGPLRPPGYVHAFSTSVTVMIAPTDDLGTLGGTDSDAEAINAPGQVVGYALTSDGARHAFRTAPNQHIDAATDDLGTLGGTSSTATAINDGGQVVGYADTADGVRHAFRTAPNRRIDAATDDLGTLAGPTSSASGINAAGQVVGSSTYASDGGHNHAFRTRAGQPIDAATDDLGTLGGADSAAEAINAAGQVVGRSTTAGGDDHAFVYSDDGGLRDLNDLIPAGSGWVLREATAINDSGQIAGNGLLHGQKRAFRLDPRPAVATATPGGCAPLRLRLTPARLPSGTALGLRLSGPARTRLSLSLRVLGPAGRVVYAAAASATTDGQGQARVRLRVRYVAHRALRGTVAASAPAPCRGSASAPFTLLPPAS